MLLSIWLTFVLTFVKRIYLLIICRYFIKISVGLAIACPKKYFPPYSHMYIIDLKWRFLF